MRWTDIPIHVIDFEGSRETGVVEFGAVTLIGGAITTMTTRVCRTRCAIPGAEARVHGLATADTEGASPFEAEWERFAALRASGVLAAHFSGTENSLLRAVWPFPRLSPDFLHPGREIAEWGPWIDTGRLAATQLRGVAAAGLSEVVTALQLDEALHEVAGRWCPVARRNYHCAPFDALASALVLQRLACDEDRCAWSLARVIAASTADAARRDDLLQGRLF